jgi:DNA modification methylase
MLLTEIAMNVQHPPMTQQIELWPIDKLVAYANNPRKNDAAVDRMAASIREFGFKIPVLARSNGEVVDGHLRLKAARKLGLTEVPILLCDEWTEAQVKAFRLMVNRSVAWAEWDEERLGVELLELRNLDFDLDLTGFEDEELVRLLAAQEAAEGLTDEDAVPELTETPVTVPGELWILDKHRVLCGDATAREDVDRLMAGDKADLILIDPPYNVGYQGKTKDALTIQNDQMSDVSFHQFLLKAHTNLCTVSKDGAGIYVFHADTEGLNFRRSLVESGFKLAQCCVWVKQSLVMGRQDYHWQHEPVLYGWKPTGAHRWYSDRTQSTVWNFDRPSRSVEHPCMKPVALIEYAMRNSSRAGDIVVDVFAGAGSAVVACEKNGRYARLLELDPRYVDVICRRWMAFSGKQAIHASDGRTFHTPNAGCAPSSKSVYRS